MKSNTVVADSGPSMLDKRPIVALVTGLATASANPKTGDMLQTYIIREDLHPVEAIKQGEDKSICGACQFRPSLSGGCYVQVYRAPANMWKTYQAGKYPTVAALTALTPLGADRFVRLGSYGDPTAVPIEVWEHLIAKAAGYTGYTHQWRAKRFQHFKTLCQASVETDEDYYDAVELGWGTFRVRPHNSDEMFAGETQCPAAKESGYTATCAECRKCSGTGAESTLGAIQHISLRAHGATARRLTTRLLTTEVK